MQFYPLYFIMAQYPLILASSYAISKSLATIIDHYAVSMAFTCITAIILLQNYIKTNIRPETRKDNLIIKKYVIDYLRKHVTPDVSIFQDCCIVYVYY